MGQTASSVAVPTPSRATRAQVIELILTSSKGVIHPIYPNTDSNDISYADFNTIFPVDSIGNIQGDKPQTTTATAGAANSKLSDPASAPQLKAQPPPPLGNEYKKPSPTKKCMAYKSLETDIQHKMQTLCNDSTNQSLCDSTWEIGKKKVQFHVVSALFAIHSTDLDDILKEHKSKTIVFEDVTPECFRFLRQYFYSLNPVISLQNIADIFYAAEKLKVSHLIVAAKQFIDECAGINDLVLVLSQLHARKLYQECDRIIATRRLFEGQQAIKVLQCENLKTMPTQLMIR